MDRKQAGDILYAIREVQRGIAMSSLNCPILRHQENITEDERKEVFMIILQETLQKIWASRLCLSGQSVCLAVRTIAQKLLSILHKTGWKGVMWVKTKLFFPFLLLLLLFFLEQEFQRFCFTFVKVVVELHSVFGLGGGPLWALSGPPHLSLL